MPRKTVLISINSNNKDLMDVFVKLDSQTDIRFEKDPGLHSSSYSIYLADLSSDLTNLSQDLIHQLQISQEKRIKIAIVLVCENKIDIEKINYIKKLLESLNQSSPLYRILIVRDLYQDILTHPVTALDNNIYQSIQTSTWKTSIKGKNEFFPLHISDLTSVILKILFLNSTSGKTFWIFGDKYTDLEIGFLLKNILADNNNHFEIESPLPNHQDESQYFKLGNETQITLSWRPEIEFETKLKQLAQKYELSPADTSPINSTPRFGLNNLIHRIQILLTSLSLKRHSTIIKNKSMALLIKIFSLVLILYLITAGIFAWSLYQEYLSLNHSLEMASKGRLEDSVKEIANLRRYNNLSQTTYEPLKPIVQFIHPLTNEQLTNLFAFNNYLSLSLENLQQTYVLADKIYKALNEGQVNLDPQESSLALQSNLALVYENLIQIKVSLESKKLPDRVVINIKKSNQFSQLDKIENQLNQAMKLAEIIPVILSNNKTTLGVLVQDQDELRPTGGLIKQLIVFTFQNGKITETKTWTPENIDAVTEGKAQSPEMLARITGSNVLKFRDMNYPADFSQAAEYILWFLNRTIGLNLDTLVSVNKSLFEKMLLEDKILEISGKVYRVQDIKSQSSDTDISKPIVDYYLKQFGSGKLPLITLGRPVISEIEEGNIKLYSKDQTAQAIIARLPLSGIVSEYPCHSGLGNYQQCISQVTYLNEANFTFAPINHSLKRDMVHSISLNQNFFTHEYKLNYSFQNDFSLLNRPYQVIYQLFAPSNSEITKIEVDSQAPNQKSSLIKLKHGQFEYFQIPLTFSPSGNHEVKITFNTPLQSNFDPNKDALSFTEIHQPGLTDKGSVLLIKIPENTSPQVITLPIQAAEGSLAVQLPAQTATFGLYLGY